MKYIALILFVLLLSANASSCFGGGGIYWRYDGQRHTLSLGQDR